MRLTAVLALLTLCPFITNAQNPEPKQNPVPLKMEQFPVVPVVRPPLTDYAASTRVEEMMPNVAVIPIETPEITSTLVLANASTANAKVTLTFYSADGKTSAHQIVIFEPHAKKEIPLASPETNTNPNERWASVTVEQGPDAMGASVVAGQVLITDHRASMPAYIDEELAMPEMGGSSQLSAVTDQSEGPPIIAVTNISSNLQHVSLTCLHDGNRAVVSSLTITAHETIKSKACSDTSVSDLTAYTSSIEKDNAQGVYGLHLESDGLPGSLAAFAIAPHFRGHDLVFSSVPFYDPLTIHSSDVVFAGVPIGAQETLPAGVYIPRLSLANFSNSPLTFSIHLADTVTSPVKDAEGNIRLPQLNVIRAGTIPPHQTGEYVFSGQEAQSGLLHSVVVTTGAKPGTYQAKLVSRSTGVLYQVELLAKETLEMNNAGVHPWTVQGDTESHIVLFNHSKSDKKVGIFISAGSTMAWDSEILLAASETREISINQLQREQIPDDHGRRLPVSAKEGVADWRTPENGDVTGRLMVTSHDGAMARNFSCGVRYGECQFYFQTLATGLAVGDVQFLYDVFANYCTFNPNTNLNCNQGSPTTGIVNLNWSVGATNIITLNSSGDQYKAEPNLRGVAGGTGHATVTASAGACSSTGTGTPYVGQCFAQLKYRSIVGGEAVHTFWYIQVPSGTQYIVDGGPSGNCSPDCGYLHAWVTPGVPPFGSSGIPADTTSVGTWWTTGAPSNASCAGAVAIYSLGTYWVQTETAYVITGPNSNTFAHEGATQAGFATTSPPTAVGW